MNLKYKYKFVNLTTVDYTKSIDPIKTTFIVKLPKKWSNRRIRKLFGNPVTRYIHSHYNREIGVAEILAFINAILGFKTEKVENGYAEIPTYRFMTGDGMEFTCLETLFVVYPFF